MEEFSRELPNLGGAAVRNEKPCDCPTVNIQNCEIRGRNLDGSDAFQYLGGENVGDGSVSINFGSTLKAINLQGWTLIGPSCGGASVRGEAVAKCTLPPAGWYCTRTAGHDGPCAAYPVNSTAAEHEAAILEVIDQRDKHHDMADQLAAQIAAMTEVEIGEHSSANEPWRNALIAGDEFITGKFKAFCNGPVSARAADAPSEPIEPLYFVRMTKTDGWREASEAAYWTFSEVNRRILYESRAADALDSQPTDPYPLLRAAFTTAESGADGYFVKFRFPTLAAMQAAHMEWHGVSSQPTDGGVRNG